MNLKKGDLVRCFTLGGSNSAIQVWPVRDPDRYVKFGWPPESETWVRHGEWGTVTCVGVGPGNLEVCVHTTGNLVQTSTQNWKHYEDYESWQLGSTRPESKEQTGTSCGNS